MAAARFESRRVAVKAHVASHGPVLAYFPGGPPPPELLKNDDASKAPPLVFSATEDVDALSATVDRFTFRGVLESDGITESYMIGLWHPGSGELEICERAPLFRVGASIECAGAARPPAREDWAAADTQQEDYAKRSARLVETFGARVNKQRLAQREANKVTTDKLLSSATGDAVARELQAHSAHHQTRAELTAELDAQRPLPPHDMEAASPADAYPLERMFSAGAWRLIDAGVRDGALELLKSEFAQYGKASVEALPKSERAVRARVLVVVDALIRMVKMSARELKTRHLFHEFTDSAGVPRQLANEMIAVFAQASQVGDAEILERSEAHRQKMLCYIAVLALHLMDFKLSSAELKALAHDLGLMEGKMRQYFLMAGCTTRRVAKRKRADAELDDDEDPAEEAAAEGAAQILSLGVPLVLPPPIKRGRAK